MNNIGTLFRQHLWVKVIGAVSLVLLLVMVLMIFSHVREQVRNLQEQTRRQSEMLAATVEGGMFDALAIGDNDTVMRQFERLRGNAEGVDVFVFDFNREVAFSTRENARGKKVDEFLSKSEDVEAVKEMIRTGKAPAAPIREAIGGEHYQSVFRPIQNEESCFHCHGSSKKILGGMQVRASTQAAMAAGVQARNRSLLLGLAGMSFLILVLYVLFQRMVNQPVRRLLELAGRMRRNDLSQSVPVIGQDEISHISARMNLVNQDLGQKIGEIQESAAHLSELASRQAAAVEQTSSSLEEMAAATRNNAEHAAGADQLMQDVQQVVQTADSSMKELIASMEEINKSSEKVSQIIKNIDEIAFQTNLLALNAAVEAARAGSAGAGFAVVAEEVRNLSIRAADAAKSTSGLIDETVEKINQGASVADKVNSAFSEMTSRTSKAGGLLNAISTASAQQSRGIQQVSQAIEDIDQGVQKVAASAEELSATSSIFTVKPVDEPQQVAEEKQMVEKKAGE